GNKPNTITTGAITMKYEESTNTISMNNALPTTDATGKVRLTAGEYFDFTLEGTIKGSENINWEIAAEDVTTGDKKIDGKYIKLYLTSLDDDGNETEVMYPRTYYNDPSANTYTGRPANMMSLTKGTTSESFSTKYRLRMYVDESYNPQGDGGNLAFSIKINAYGKTGSAMPKSTVAQTLLSNGLGIKGSFDTSDTEQTFITGENPNNYIWYSGKLWRAVSIDPTDNSVKLVTQWGISSIPYNQADNSVFKGSYMEQWLNDTSVDGFLGNLREPEKFIKTDDSVWNATMTSETTKPEKTTMVTDAVGLLNIYEYTMSYKNATTATGYLNDNTWWSTLTPISSSNVFQIISSGTVFEKSNSKHPIAIRPAINLKANINIVKGYGTSDNPYRLEGDTDTPTSGTLLSTRYSGEYISFGTGENNLYRIVSHENGTGTKITSAAPLMNSGSYKTMQFGSNAIFSKDDTVGTFLNNDYLTSNTYLTDDQVNMIEDNTTWYLGSLNNGISYKLAKYQDATGNDLTTDVITAKVGLLRLGELMIGKDENSSRLSPSTWLLNSYNSSNIWFVDFRDKADAYISNKIYFGVKPAMNLKQNVVITGGKGTKEEPFTIKLGN
ncbi:MAG: hypothetical protein PUF66_06100, partial [Clostridium sp.]|nr:hypothetical protein [Clostridium sp.]